MHTQQQEFSEKALKLKRRSQAWRDRETISVEEAGVILGVGRNSAYAAAHNGQLPGVWIGKRFLVSVPRLRRMLDGEAA
jgi:excisionase family DNA binding protein